MYNIRHIKFISFISSCYACYNKPPPNSNFDLSDKKAMINLDLSSTVYIIFDAKYGSLQTGCNICTKILNALFKIFIAAPCKMLPIYIAFLL